MQKVLTAEQMREVDRQTTEKYGIPSILLMENAAHAAARIITERLGGEIAGKSVLILCGKGNNGGDGAALARILWTLGADVSVYLFGKVEETKDAARINFEILKNLSEGDNKYINSFYFEETDDVQGIFSDEQWREKEVFVDALFGTGLIRPIERSFARFLWNMKGWVKRPLFVSLDIPSGLNADLYKELILYPIHRRRQLKNDSGEAIEIETFGGNFRADLTVTFTAPKLANVFPPASDFGGELVVANIGSPQELIDNSPSQTFVAEKQDAQDWLYKTKVKKDSYKKTRGTVLIIAGSRDFSGAAALAADACFAAGAGMVSLCVPESARQIVAAKVSDEIIVRGFAATRNGAFDESAARDVLELSEKMNVAALGCGLSSNEESTRKFARETVENRRTPIVVDADGLNSLAPFDVRGSDDLPVVLTPHIGEFQRLLGRDAEVKDRIETARAFARKHNVILLLKGERSIVAAPDGTIVINPTGNAGISRAGSGDTLTGIITGFLAQTFGVETPSMRNTFETVVAALYVSGLAGDIAAEKFGQRLMTATDIRDCLGAAFDSLERGL